MGRGLVLGKCHIFLIDLLGKVLPCDSKGGGFSGRRHRKEVNLQERVQIAVGSPWVFFFHQFLDILGPLHGERTEGGTQVKNVQILFLAST